MELGQDPIRHVTNMAGSAAPTATAWAAQQGGGGR